MQLQIVKKFFVSHYIFTEKIFLKETPRSNTNWHHSKRQWDHFRGPPLEGAIKTTMILNRNWLIAVEELSQDRNTKFENLFITQNVTVLKKQAQNGNWLLIVYLMEIYVWVEA